jgi:hypothetical protein
MKASYWEAAEGGIGVWERLIAEPREFRKLAVRALEILHFDPFTGQVLPHWEDRCTAACYDCLLSYSNQPDHRHLDRHNVRNFLFALSRSDVAPITNGPTDEIGIISVNRIILARALAFEARHLRRLDEHRLDRKFLSQFPLPLIAEMRRREYGQTPRDSPIQQLAGDHPGFDGLSDANVVRDQEPPDRAAGP